MMPGLPNAQVSEHQLANKCLIFLMTCGSHMLHGLSNVFEIDCMYMMLSHCTLLLQIMAELATSDTINSVPGHNIIETVAGTESDSTLGLTYYFIQSELQELLESERCMQLSILAHQYPASPAVV